MPARRVAEGLGITTESLRTWRRQLSGMAPALNTAVEGKLPAIAPTAQELQAQVRRLHAQLQSVTNQRDILSLNRSTGFSRFAAIKLFLAGLHLCHELTHPHRRQRLLLAGTEFREPLGRRQCLSGIDLV